MQRKSISKVVVPRTPFWNKYVQLFQNQIELWKVPKNSFFHFNILLFGYAPFFNHFGLLSKYSSRPLQCLSGVIRNRKKIWSKSRLCQSSLVRSAFNHWATNYSTGRKVLQGIWKNFENFSERVRATTNKVSYHITHFMILNAF